MIAATENTVINADQPKAVKNRFFNTVHIVGQSHKGLCGRQCKRIVADEQFSLKGVDQHEENRCQKCNYQQTQDTKYDHIGSFFLVIIVLPPYVW